MASKSHWSHESIIGVYLIAFIILDKFSNDVQKHAQ